MTDQFVDANKMVLITPPPKLVQQWLEDSPEDDEFGISGYIATQAANWGGRPRAKRVLQVATQVAAMERR